MKYDIILFDLDGTLTDSEKGIINSAAYALESFGINLAEYNDLRRFIGPPLRDTFRDELGFSDEQTEVAIVKYRERFEKTGMLEENKMYAGITELLEKLAMNDAKLGLATSKAKPYAVKIAEHFGFAKYFSYIGGAGMDGAGGAKKDVIADCLENILQNEVYEKRVVMIGDRKHDVLGAKFHGLPCIGVLWGYGSREELVAAGADYIAETMEELWELLK